LVTNREWLTCEDFADRVGERFEVAVGEGPALVLELIEASEGAEAGGPGPNGQERQQFSLVFRGTPGLPQGTYRLSHAKLGDLDIFLVPIGSDGDGMQYEAAFA
jgi:hypothetical protein